MEVALIGIKIFGNNDGLGIGIRDEALAVIRDSLIQHSLDALHVALAESAGVKYFCTGDDKLLRRLKQIEGLRVKAMSPIELIQEVGV